MVGIDIQYNLPDLFSAVFGIKHYKIAGKAQDAPMARESYLGTPILTTVTFKAGNYQSYDKQGNPMVQTMNHFELPVATLLNIRRAKNVIKTKVNAGKGTVKEMFGFGDFIIDVNGICVPDPKQPQGLFTPQQMIDELWRWEGLADAVRIDGGLVINKEIHDVVIEDFNTWQLAGKPNIIPFRMRWISDEPIELLLQ